MKRRLAIAAAAATFMALGSVPTPADATEAAGAWCKTYCDAIHLGCRKTLGWLDEEACGEWHTGCLDGCSVNQR